MLLTTTSNIEGKQIQYLGIVSGEAILGANIYGVLAAQKTKRTNLTTLR